MLGEVNSAVIKTFRESEAGIIVLFEAVPF